MFEKFLEATLTMASTTVHAVNAVHFGVMKKIGLIDQFTTSYCEDQESDESHNLRLDTNRRGPFFFHLETQAYLDGFFDPKNEDEFLRWHFIEGSYVTLPGIAENAVIHNGRQAFVAFDTLEYSFEFSGKDGQEYVYKGHKKISIFNPIRSWSNLEGGVYEKESGRQILDSITFFGGGDFSETILPFLHSVKIR